MQQKECKNVLLTWVYHLENRKVIIMRKHPFHLVDPSPWPLFASFAAFLTTIGGVMYMHSYQGGELVLPLGIIMVIYAMFVWWRDVIREATFEGHHTTAVQLGLRYGMILFLASEIMFFLAFFWAFFHSSLAPTVEIGAIWPPKGIEVLNPWEIPFLNTLILLTSGASVTWAHHAIVVGNRQQATNALVITVVLAIIFTGFQAYEYLEAPFTIADGVYGSTFYLATGFHGFHVIVGTLFLIVCLGRVIQNHFTKLHHFGFEAAAWYWHMVDVVWLFLFVCIYYWGGA
jgi:cytochrome c oxidase subunit 3